jgi:hypothetical protein
MSALTVFDGGAGFARASATFTEGFCERDESLRQPATSNRKKGVRGGNMVSPAVN